MSPTTYDKADEDVHDFVRRVQVKNHGELCDEANKGKLNTMVTVDVLMANNPDKPAVTHNGYPCYAKVRIVGVKERTMGRADAEIIIDEVQWNKMNAVEREALIDHELQHLEPATTKTSTGTGKRKKDSVVKQKYDDRGRPKLKMRKHDLQIGWFRDCARRYGDASVEVKQAREVWKDEGQLFFSFVKAKDGDVVAKPPKRAATTADAFAN